MTDQKLKAVIITADALGDDAVEQQNILLHFAEQAEDIFVLCAECDRTGLAMKIASEATGLEERVKIFKDPNNDNLLKENGQYKAKQWHEVDNVYLAFLDQHNFALEDVMFVSGDKKKVRKLRKQYRATDKTAKKDYENIKVLFVIDKTMAGIEKGRVLQDRSAASVNARLAVA